MLRTAVFRFTIQAPLLTRHGRQRWISYWSSLSGYTWSGSACSLVAEDRMSQTGMPRQPDNDQDEIESYVNYVRVALAVAIIKNKPAGQDVGCYTEQLRKGLTDQQTDWKEKYDKVKQEMCAMKQQKALSDIGGGVRMVLGDCQSLTTADDHASKDVVSQEHEHSTHDGEVVQSPGSWKLASHFQFLTKIASLKQIISGELVIHNSAAFSAVVDTYLDCITSIQQAISSVSSQPGADNSKLLNQRKIIYRDLVGCMVELLVISSDVARCSDIQAALEALYEHCVSTLLQALPSDKQSLRSESGWILEKFCQHKKSSVFISRCLVRQLVDVTRKIDQGTSQDIVKIISLIENIPIVTDLLVRIVKKMSSSQNADSTDNMELITYSDRTELAERLDKLLTRFPLYSIHLQQTLSVLGLSSE